MSVMQPSELAQLNMHTRASVRIYVFVCQKPLWGMT